MKLPNAGVEHTVDVYDAAVAFADVLMENGTSDPVDPVAVRALVKIAYRCGRWDAECAEREKLEQIAEQWRRVEPVFIEAADD